MLSLKDPSVLKQIKALVYGYMPLQYNDGRYCLIIKVSKEVILTARVNNSFKIYIVPDPVIPNQSLGFLSAFLDNDREPLALFTPLDGTDETLCSLPEALSQDTFKLYFFDEHNRELMGVHAQVSDLEHFRKTLSSLSFSSCNQDEIHATYTKMNEWFYSQDTSHNAFAFHVCLGERLYPDNFFIVDLQNIDFGNIDITNEEYDVESLREQINPTSLNRREAGAFQERDIVALLRRCFLGDKTVLNPVRDDTGTELCDILIVSDETVLLIQAKDSPNTEDMLRRSIERKKSVTRKHIEKAARQLRGAITHVLGDNKIVLKNSSPSEHIDTGDRDVFGLIIVNEIFDDEFRECSTPVLAVAKEKNQPCLLVDYATLNSMTLYSPSKEAFLDIFKEIFGIALKNDQFPRIRFSGELPESENKNNDTHS